MINRIAAAACSLALLASATTAGAQQDITDFLKRLPLPTQPKPQAPAGNATKQQPASAPTQSGNARGGQMATTGVSIPIGTESSLQTVALGGFQGRNGEQLTQDLEVALSRLRTAKGGNVRVIPREDVTRAMASIPRNERWGAELAKRLNADAIVYGEVTSLQATPTRVTKTEQKCVQRKPGSGVEKALGLDCQKWASVNTYCTQTDVAMQALVRIYDARQASVIRNEQVSGQSTTEACPTAPGKTTQQLIADAQDQVSAAAVALIAPLTAGQSVPLMPLDASIRPATARQQFSDALAFAGDGRVDRACPLFRSAYDLEKQSVPLTYNMGACEEAAGNGWEARQLYETADKMLSKSDPVITDALARTDRAMKDRQKAVTAKGGAETGGPTKQIVVTSVSGDKALSEVADRIKQEKRVALVIGNAGYQKGALRNSVHDAQDIAQSLKQLGFHVINANDADLKRMKQAIDEFGNQLGEESVALFYYAGHGMQVKGENYLIPVDADIKSENEVPYNAVNVGEVLAKFEASRAGVGIVILDACRDNPFSRSLRSQQRGLASIDAPRGLLIAYATAPGKTAQDGSERNGLYTSQLLKVLQQPNLKVEDVFKRVRVAVTNASNGEQLPWESSSLVGDFYFSAQTQ
jgi:hypothetical protein